MRKCRYALVALFVVSVFWLSTITQAAPSKEVPKWTSSKTHVVTPLKMDTGVQQSPRVFFGQLAAFYVAIEAAKTRATLTYLAALNQMNAQSQSVGSTSPPSTTTPTPDTSGVDLLLSDAPAYVVDAFHCIAYDHESGGNPTAVNPSSGDSGLYQFNDGTWASVIAHAGGQGFPSKAMYATVAQQDTVAYWAWQQDGFQPWNGDQSCWE